MTAENNKSLLSAAIREKIDAWLLRYPPDERRSGVFEALRLVQEENGGSLTTELMTAVADYLGIPHIAVFEVATFYSMYHLEPVGRHVINVCTNISCMLKNSDAVVDHLNKRLGIKFNETTADGRYTLKEVECLGACIDAPVCHVGKKYYEKLSPEKVDAMLEELK